MNWTQATTSATPEARIRCVMQIRGITPNQLAQRIGVRGGRMHDILRGIHLMDSVFNIAEVLQVPSQWILSGNLGDPTRYLRDELRDELQGNLDLMSFLSIQSSPLPKGLL
jgi:hypothetical protein